MMRVLILFPTTLVSKVAYPEEENLAQDAVSPKPEDEKELPLRALWHKIEDLAKNDKKSTIEYLANSPDITLFMRGVNYKVDEDGKTILPGSASAYSEAVENYKEHLYGTFYIPSTELMTDPNGNRYGTYAFNFDRTYFNCDVTHDLSIRHVLLIGKQYAENKEATFNVNQRQDASIVGIAEIIQEPANVAGDPDAGIEEQPGPGIQILADQNEYVTFQAQLRFTVTECENEFIPGDKIIIDDNESKDPDATKPAYEPVSDIASKLALK